MRAVVCLAIAVACLSAPLARAQAQTRAYAVDIDHLYSVNLATRQATDIGAAGSSGPQPIGDLSGLTTTPDGTLYAASDTVKALVRIDPATGKAAVVGRFGIVNGGDATAPVDYAMAAACDGSLWLASATMRQLWKVNPTNAQPTLVGSLGYTITGLAVKGDELYGIGGRGDEGWYRIDTTTGSASRIGTLGSAVTYLASASPAFAADGSVLAAFNYVPPPSGTTVPDWSDLASINTGSGAATILGSITGPASLRGIGVRGFTIGAPVCKAPPATANAQVVPVNATWMLWLQGLLLALVAGFAARRRVAPAR